MHAVAQVGSALLAPAVIVLLVGCGGGGNGADDAVSPSSQPPPSDPPTSQPPTASAVGGWWLGEATIPLQGVVTLRGLVAEDGRAFFYTYDGTIYSGLLTSSGSNVSAQLEISTPSGDGFGILSGTIEPRVSINALATVSTSRTGNPDITFRLGYEALYDTDSSLAYIAGNYIDQRFHVDERRNIAGVLNLASNGDLFVQDPDSGCIANGRVATIDADYNAYDLQFSFSGCTGEYAFRNAGTYSGIATYDPDWALLLVFANGPTPAGTVGPHVFLLGREP